MMKNYLKPILAVSALAVGASAHAMPAYPGPVQVTQPDGSTVEVRLHGDERINWISTPDGYTLQRDDAGYLTFARKSGKKLLASDLRYDGPASVRRAAAAGIVRGLTPEAPAPRAKALSTSDLQISNTFPTTGTHKLLMLLVNFSDTKTTYTQQDFDRLMNQEGYNGTGSFRDFYLEDSYGKLDITTTVTRWVTVNKPRSSYNTDNAADLVVDALGLLDDEIDLRDFDNNGDGVLDGLAVIHQGLGQEVSGNTTDIWSHSGVITGKSFDGVQLRNYTIEPEMGRNKMTAIGVICHEFGHNLGAPDFYDVDYSTYGEYPGTGLWDLMASGAWNGSNGDRPAHTNMWQKVQLGWVEPVTLTSDTRIDAMGAAANNALAYRFDTTVDGEYFLIENRQKTGRFDVALPSHGLIVYHVNEPMIASTVNLNQLNNKFPQAMYIVSAGASEDPAGVDPTLGSPDLYGPVNSDIAPFPGSRNRTSFNDTSIPSTRSIVNGRYSYKGLANISENADGTVSFDFITYDIPASPLNLKATATRGDITVSWDAPSDPSPVSYNLYRNDELLCNLKETSYRDTDIADLSDVKYSVDAVYTNQLVSPAVDVQLYLPVNFITSIDASAEGSDVTLDWNISTDLTRTHGGYEDFYKADYFSDIVEYAHRFRAEDLAIYKGFKIRKIAFCSYLGMRECGLTITVYEAEPGSDKLSIGSQRTLKEFAAAQWFSGSLTNAYEITGDKDVWIAVRVASNTGAVSILTDVGPTIRGYGNMYRRNDGEWQEDGQLPGNFWLRAELRAPAESSFITGPEIQPVVDYMADTSFPQAFSVYRDDVLVGTAAGRRFVDTDVPNGTHIYTISSLYKGYNESPAKTVEVLVDNAGVADVVAEVSATVSAVNGGIVISGLTGPAAVTDMTGRIVARPTADGFVSLAAGLYIVNTPAAHKVLVK